MLMFSLLISEEVILAEERTTEEEKMHIMEGELKFIGIIRIVHIHLSPGSPTVVESKRSEGRRLIS